MPPIIYVVRIRDMVGYARLYQIMVGLVRLLYGMVWLVMCGYDMVNCGMNGVLYVGLCDVTLG